MCPGKVPQTTNIKALAVNETALATSRFGFCVIRSIPKLLLHLRHVEFAHVDEVAGDGRGGSHDRAYEVRAAVFALASLEIAVAGAGAALVRRQHVGVHADAHAATGVAPLKTGFAEDFVQAFFFGL